MKQPSTQNAPGKGDKSKNVAGYKCGGMGHIAKNCRSVAQLDVDVETQGSSSERVDGVGGRLFLTELDRIPT